MSRSRRFQPGIWPSSWGGGQPLREPRQLDTWCGSCAIFDLRACRSDFWWFHNDFIRCRMSRLSIHGAWHEVRSFHSLWGLETENGGTCRPCFFKQPKCSSQVNLLQQCYSCRWPEDTQWRLNAARARKRRKCSCQFRTCFPVDDHGWPDRSTLHVLWMTWMSFEFDTFRIRRKHWNVGPWGVPVVDLLAAKCWLLRGVKWSKLKVLCDMCDVVYICIWCVLVSASRPPTSQHCCQLDQLDSPTHGRQCQHLRDATAIDCKAYPDTSRHIQTHPDTLRQRMSMSWMHVNAFVRDFVAKSPTGWPRTTRNLVCSISFAPGSLGKTITCPPAQRLVSTFSTRNLIRVACYGMLLSLLVG